MGEFKQKLFGIVDWVYQEENSLIDKLTDAERTTTGSFKKWTAKDIIAHNSYWKLLRAKSIDDVLNGRTPQDIKDFQKINEEIFREYQNCSWEDAMNFSKEAHDFLKNITGTASDEELRSKKKFPLQGDKEIWKIIVIYCCLHPLMHFDKFYDGRDQTYYAINLWKEAMELLEKLPASSGILGNVNYNLARFYARSDQNYMALRALNEAIKLNPGLVKQMNEEQDLSFLKYRVDKP